MFYTNNDIKKAPLVSIIIPVYNVEPYLHQCIESVINQTYKRIEILLIESGSTDASARLCDEWEEKDNRIHTIHTAKEGLGRARDVGIDAAKGEWICFVDSDDFVHPEYVEILLHTAIKNDSPTCQCRFQRFYEKGEEPFINKIENVDVRLMNYKYYFIYIYRYAEKGHNPFCVWCNIYHISLFRDVRFGNFQFAEDSNFTPRIIYAAKESMVPVIDSVLYFYRQRQGSLLRSKTSLIRIDRYHAKKGVMDFWHEHGEMELYALFYPDFFNCMVTDYIDLCADLPKEHEQYDFLRKEIISSMKEECRFFSPNTTLHPEAKNVWMDLSASMKKKIVIYGFGHRGKEIYRWLKYFGFQILEVWDHSFDKEWIEDNVPFRKPHEGLPKDIRILILIENRFIALEAEIELKKLGYRCFDLLHPVFDAVKYGKYQAFLPELIESYGRLLT